MERRFAQARKRKTLREVEARADEVTLRKASDSVEEADEENDVDIMETSSGDEGENIFVDDLLITEARADNESVFGESLSSMSSLVLCQLQHLIDSAFSQAGLDLHFAGHFSPHERFMRTFLNNNSYLAHSLSLCALCARDIDSCSCPDGPSKSTVVLASIAELVNRLLNGHYAHIRTLHERIASGVILDTPLAWPFFQNRVKVTGGPVQPLSFVSSWDGVRLKGHSRLKCWPLGLMSIDMDDAHRAREGAVFLAAVYFGAAEPSTAVHDRLLRYVVRELECVAQWKGIPIDVKVVTGAHDDPVYDQYFLLFITYLELLPRSPTFLFAPIAGGKSDIIEVFGSIPSASNSLRNVVKHVSRHAIEQIIPMRVRHRYTVAAKPNDGKTAIPSSILNACVDAFLASITFPDGDEKKKNAIESTVCDLWSNYFTYYTTNARSKFKASGGRNNGGSQNEME